jgi:hypothetical protein
MTQARFVRVRVSGVNGDACATIEAVQWDAMAPISRVLWLHEECRAALAGKPFKVLGVDRA